MVAGRIKTTFVLSVIQSAIFASAFFAGAYLFNGIDRAVHLVTWISIPYMLAIVMWYVTISKGNAKATTGTVER